MTPNATPPPSPSANNAGPTFSPPPDMFEGERPKPRRPVAWTGKLVAIAIVAAVVLLAWRSVAGGASSALAGWSADWDSSTASARASGKPALVLFTADWCPPCKQLKAELKRDDVAQYLRDNHTLVVVDLTDRDGPNNARASEYGVKAIPTLILYDPDGRERARTHGMDGSSLVRWLSRGGR